MVLLEDFERVPDVFFGFGAIPESELNDWLKCHALVLPSDLLKFWQLTGGGDVFESETILRPSVAKAATGVIGGKSETPSHETGMMVGTKANAWLA